MCSKDHHVHKRDDDDDDNDDVDDDDDKTFSRKITGKESRVVECVPEIRGVSVSSWVMDTFIFHHQDRYYKTQLLFFFASASKNVPVTSILNLLGNLSGKKLPKMYHTALTWHGVVTERW